MQSKMPTIPRAQEFLRELSWNNSDLMRRANALGETITGKVVANILNGTPVTNKKAGVFMDAVIAGYRDKGILPLPEKLVEILSPR